MQIVKNTTILYEPSFLFFKTNGERADNEKGGKRMLVYRLLLVVDRGIEPLCQD